MTREREVLIKWLLEEIEKVKQVEGKMFMGIPEAWYNNLHLLCENGHVTTHYLKSEALGYNACIECMKPVHMGPEITEKQLQKILSNGKEETTKC